MSGAPMVSNLYNPGALSDAELRRSFSVRFEVLDDLIAILRQESAQSIASNQLILAQRGMGKTTLLYRLGLAIREQDDLAQRFLPLTFSEEQYGLNLTEFWLGCLDSLCERLRRNGVDVSSLEKERGAFANPREDAEEAALALLMRYQIKLARRFILLVDNLDLILESLDERESWAFRAALQSPGGPILIAAAALAPEDGFRYDKAFYEHLHTRWLSALSRDELFDLIENLAQQCQRPDISQELARNPERVLAFQYFTGGNPRALKMLFNILQTGLDQDVQHDLAQLLDNATPLYKARMEALSTQQRRVFTTVANAWAPLTAAAVEEKLKLGINSTSANLAALVKSGLLQHTPVASKKLHFEVAERLFNIWYLMRANTRESLRMLWLVRFLQTLYRNDPAVIVKLSEQMLADPRLTHVVIMVSDGVLEASGIRERALAKLSAGERAQYLAAAKNSAELDDLAWQNAADEFSARTSGCLDWALPILRAHQIDLTTLLDLDDAWDVVHALCADNDDAIVILQQQPVSTEQLRGIGRIKVLQEHHDEAETLFLQALAIDPESAFLWNHLGFAQNEQQKWEQAEASYQKAITLDPTFSLPFCNLGILLVDRDRFDEAEVALRRGVALQPKVESFNLAFARLLNTQACYSEAELILRGSLKRKSKQLASWKLLVATLDESKQSNAAEATLREAIALFPNEEELWRELSWFWQEAECVQSQSQASLQQLFESALMRQILPESIDALLSALMRGGHGALLWQLLDGSAFAQKLQEQARPLFEAIRLSATRQVDAIALLPAEVRELCYLVLQRIDADFAARVALAQPALVTGYAKQAQAAEETLDQRRRRFVARRGDLVHKLKAKDTTGRWAYYFVMVENKREAEFRKAIKGVGTVDLEDFGTIIASCYGEEPSSEVRAYLARVYGFSV
jgi:Flp pilus assembly protein TadD